MQRNDRRTRRTELRSCRHLVGFVTLLYKDLFKPALCKGGGPGHLCTLTRFLDVRVGIPQVSSKRKRRVPLKPSASSSRVRPLCI